MKALYMHVVFVVISYQKCCQLTISLLHNSVEHFSTILSTYIFSYSLPLQNSGLQLIFPLNTVAEYAQFHLSIYYGDSTLSDCATYQALLRNQDGTLRVL